MANHNKQLYGTHFQKGEVSWDYHKGDLLLHSEGKLVEDIKISDDWDRNNLFLDMMTEFLDAVKGTRSVGSTLSEGVEVLRLAVAAKDQIYISGIK